MAAPAVSSRPKATSTQTVTQNVSSQAPDVGVIPFIRGSGWGRYPIQMPAGSGAVQLTSTTQTLGPIQVKAYDYMRAIVVDVQGSAGVGTAVTTTEDGPWNLFAGVEVLQPNGQTMYKTSSGFTSAMIHAHGYYRNYGDPRAYQGFVYTSGSGTAPNASFRFRIPFELNLADSLGNLPNKDANAPFQLTLTLNAASNVWGGTVSTSPTFNIKCWLEAADQPPTMLDGAAVETTPPAMNTLQRWTEQPIAINAGQFDARIRKLGNYVRLFVPILRRASSTRANGDLDWPDPVQIVLDEDVKDNISKNTFIHDIFEQYGYGPVGSTNDAFSVSGGPGRWNGVFPIQYLSGPAGYDNGDRWLPTIESEDYLLRGSWGNNGTLTVAIGEVLPQGNVFE